MGSNLNDLSDISNSIYYYSNYLKVLNCTDDEIVNVLKKYYQISPFSNDFIRPLFTVKTSTRASYNDERVRVMLKEVFK